MQIILLSGGSGRRLWPISNDIRSKQFIKIFKKEDGGYESMLQRMYRQAEEVLPDAKITIASSRAQVSAVRNQLGDRADISVEPCRRDTFPAVVLATAYLVDVKGMDPEEPVLVCPVDPFVDSSYFLALGKLYEQACKGEAGLVLMGIEPAYPSEKYGYIIPKRSTGTADSMQSQAYEQGEVLEVKCFREKPDTETAKRYIEEGALWNGGVFAYKPGHILDIARRLIGYTGYRELYGRYAELSSVSFDYAVVEKEERIQAVRYAGTWKDLGTWNTLTEAMEETAVGEAELDGACRNVHVINELGIPVVAMGLEDVVVSASPEGILVADKGRSSYLKPMVDKLEHRVMYAEKSWGSYRVLDVEDGSQTVKVTLQAGHGMNYHSHRQRDEVWVVTEGSGKAVIDGQMQKICIGDVVIMKAGQKHTVVAETELKMVEVQIGEGIHVEDKEKHPMAMK